MSKLFEEHQKKTREALIEGKGLTEKETFNKMLDVCVDSITKIAIEQAKELNPVKKFYAKYPKKKKLDRYSNKSLQGYNNKQGYLRKTM